MEMVRWDVLGLVLANILSNSWYSLVVPFLPLELKSWGIDVSVIGWIFCMYSVAVIIGSPIVGKIMTNIGRKFILIGGLCLMGLSMIGFGLITLSPSLLIFTVLAFILRFLQGMSSWSIQTTSYAIVSVTFPDNQEKYIALIETSVGIGLILGPVIGSSLYSLTGFSPTFFIIGGIFLLITPILFFAIPNSINKRDEDEDSNIKKSMDQYENGTMDLPERNISFTKLLWIRRFLLASMGGMISMFMYCYMEPVLSFRLSEFNISNFWIGMFFWIQPISYIIVSILISWLTDRFSNRGLIVTGAFFCAFSMLFVGPSNFFPNRLYLMGLGQLLIGGFGLFLMVPVIPEMISAASSYYPNKIIEITDISAGVFNSGLGIGQVLGPLFGSYATKMSDFRVCSDMVGFFILTYATLYFIFGDGIYLLRSSWKDKVQKQFDVIRNSPARNVRMRGRVGSNILADGGHDIDFVKLKYNTPLISKKNPINHL